MYASPHKRLRSHELDFLMAPWLIAKVVSEDPPMFVGFRLRKQDLVRVLVVNENDGGPSKEQTVETVGDFFHEDLVDAAMSLATLMGRMDDSDPKLLVFHYGQLHVTVNTVSRRKTIVTDGDLYDCCKKAVTFFLRDNRVHAN